MTDFSHSSISPANKIGISSAEVRDSLIRVDSLRKSMPVFERMLDQIIDEKSEKRLFQFIIDELPHRRSLYFASLFTSIRHYPFYPGTVAYAIKTLANWIATQNDSQYNLLQARLVQDDILHKSLAKITAITPFDPQIELIRKEDQRNTYVDEGDRSEPQMWSTILLGSSDIDSPFRAILREPVLFPSFSEYSALISRSLYESRSHDGDEERVYIALPVKVNSLLAAARICGA